MIKTIKPQDFAIIIEDIVSNKKMTYLDAYLIIVKKQKWNPKQLENLFRVL